ncbi:hypothetical protein HU200_056308 [Digitaria exilis]|uniref:RING-type E3 ubiquitin transferase n=1 Tax=Digitaria exilis TaxID=1010633 RepID=A0A835AH27_9POAL|nr:hypothetical protein HU200_056308 [Digitaria exilis]
MEIEETAAGEMGEMVAPAVSTVAVAISGSRSSRHALKWALDKFVPEGRVLFRILHVRPAITMVPTPRDTNLIWHHRCELTKMFYKVEAEAVLLESDDVAAAISEEIVKFNICKLVIGSSSKNIFRRKLKGSKTATKISESIPSFCTAYVISKGKLSFVRSATSDVGETPQSISSSTVSSPSSRSLSSCAPSGNIQDDLRLQIERLRVKLQHLNKLHEGAENESFDTKNLHKLHTQHIEDEIKLKEMEMTDDKVRRLVSKQEMEEHVAGREAGLKQRSNEIEIEERRSYNSQEANEIETGKKIAGHCFDEYNRYTWEEIQASTSSFSSALMIGKGSYGTVYKAKFHHTVAAVKVLNSPEGCGTQQLHQELEVLGKIRHPHLLMMLGACPERGCLVYEYMENGSLDDMLQRRNNMPPLTWFDRFRIAWEVATALMFLHSSKPEPVIHRDLKPANILLDRNLVSKIGDVGLSTLLPSMGQYLSTMIKNTAPVGTFCYIDPEYQRTGVLSMKSDVYALGIVLLQLLTARSPMGLAHVVETALDDGCFVDILDAAAGQWPLNETQELAVLALKCSEMRRKDRPDLNQNVLPILERLKDVATKARESVLQGHTAPPSHFICPILQEVMIDPYVASDGYTYDRKAIELWLSTNNTSPMTNLRLPNKSLIPNHSLRSAIMDWRSKSK